MWIIVFVVLTVAALLLMGWLAWRLVRKAGALLAEVSDVLDQLGTVGALAEQLRVPDDEVRAEEEETARA